LMVLLYDIHNTTTAHGINQCTVTEAELNC